VTRSLFPSVVAAVSAACLFSSCATRPRAYAPPDAARINASTHRVSVAVDRAHTSARKAQTSVSEAVKRTAEVREETRKLKDVPPTLLAKVNELDSNLRSAQVEQALLEKQLVEADAAKAQVEKDKTDYFAAAQKLADEATAERDKRIKVEKALSWYRWHWWGSWIVLGLGIVACGLLAFLKFTGRLAIAGSRLMV
jgi:hypothetical protein